MKDTKPMKITPLAGIDNASGRDDELQIRGDSPAVYLRDAVNVTFDNGRASMRPGLGQVSGTPYKEVWQSPLHRDVFGGLDDDWVLIDTANWSATVLAQVGKGRLSHVVLNGQVLVAAPMGIFAYNGVQAQRFTLGQAAEPFASIVGGSLEPGRYSYALALLRGDLEGPLSPMASVDLPVQGGISLTTATQPDPTATGVRLYMTRHNGGELLRVGDFPASGQAINISVVPEFGAPAMFPETAPMPTGDYLRVWRGRLVVARGRTLFFSRPMAYHVHNPSTDHVTLAQRITFVEPVEGGIWVGQVDGVVFLSGNQPQDMTVVAKAARAPIEGSSIALAASDAQQFTEGGTGAVAWLTSIGFAVGTGEGGIIEPQARRIKGLSGVRGSTVVLDKRLTSAVS